MPRCLIEGPWKGLWGESAWSLEIASWRGLWNTFKVFEKRHRNVRWPQRRRRRVP